MMLRMWHGTTARDKADRYERFLVERAMPDPLEFGRRWLEAWNAHDLETLLAHFDEEVVFTSPVAAQLRAYWTEALRQIPDLRFELIGVYAGIRSLVIHFRNQKGGLVNEVLTFDQGLVKEGHGTYLDRGHNLAGALR